MRKIIVLYLFLLPLISAGQNRTLISLEECQRMAAENYPSLKQKGLIELSSDISMNNLTKNYLPVLTFAGQASLQSAVTEIPQIFPGMDIPEASADQYKVYLDLNQVIYDGGLTSRQKRAELASRETELQALEVEKARLKDRVNLLYFNILLIQANEDIITTALEDLKARLKKTEAAVKNGAALQSSADVLKAEVLRLEQQFTELHHGKMAGIGMMSVYTGQTIPENPVYSLPGTEFPAAEPENRRAELRLYQLQMNKLDRSAEIASVRLMPRISAFGQAGYGRPGLNMLSDEFEPYYIVGARLSWNFWNWNQTSGEKKVIALRKDMLNLQKETWEQSVKAEAEKLKSDISKYSELLLKDEEIIVLRQNILSDAGSKLGNGVITATEYVAEVQALNQARLNRDMHRIMLEISKINYLNNYGNF